MTETPDNYIQIALEKIDRISDAAQAAYIEGFVAGLSKDRQSRLQRSD